MTNSALNRAAMNTINAFLQEVRATEKRAAEAHTEPGSIGGSTTHPVKDVDDSTEEASEGARSAENTADVKADQGTPSVDNTSENVASKKAVDGKSEAGGVNPPGTASADQLQIGTKKEPTGQDPAVETSSVKAEKEDSTGGELGNTTHPARTNNGELDGYKYASMSIEQLAQHVSSLGNAFLASIGDLQKKAELTENQKKLDTDSDGKIEGSDLASLRKGEEKKEDSEDEKSAADAAGQLGWELAGLFTNQTDKQAADAVVQSTLEEIIKVAMDDAERVAEYVISYHQALQKQAEGEMPTGADPAAMAGAAPMGGGEAGGDEDAALAELEQLCQQLGITPEELIQMLSEGAGGAEGGAGAPPVDETAGAAPGMEVEAADKRGTSKKAAAKKGASSKAVLDYVQEVLARSK